MNKSLPALAAILALAGAAHAASVKVEIFGVIEYNQIKNGSLAKTIVHAGDAASISFLLDSNVYMNDPDGLPTRGYSIDQPSFTATFGPSSLGLANPFPAGDPMFILRNNDPAADGFFLSTGTAWDAPLAMSEDGFFGPLGCHFAVGYLGDTLTSLDITDAVGTYDYDGLTNFYWSTDDGGMDPMWINIDHMTISLVPAPATLALLAPLGLLRRRR